MNSLGQRFRQASPGHLWLLTGLVLAFIPHFVRLPILIVAPSLLLLLWRLLFELKLFALPSRLIRMVFTLVAVVATFASFHTLLGKQAGVGLLIVMLCLKLMEMRTLRDVGVVIGLGYFVVITVFLNDQSIFIGLYMLMVVIFLTTALITFSRPQSKIPQWQNLRYTGLLLAQATPLMLLLFMLFPRIPGPLWSLPSDHGGASTGLSDNMSPGKISQLSNNDEVAFRAQFRDELPPPRQRYWRGPVFTQFDGITWRKPKKTVRDRFITTDLSYRASGSPVHYTVTLEPHNQRWLFALDLPAETPPESELSPDFEILAHHPVQQLLRYDIHSYPDYQLNASTQPDLYRYLQLPYDAAPQARQLAQQFHVTSKTKSRLVERALNYFREQPFFYTRQPPLLLNDPVDEFLFDTRRGFCEHYASAFVFIMRAAGIPARVVTGYQGGEMNPLGDYFIVRQSNAHAWAEVWLRNQGWVRIDPTAVIPAHRIEHQRDLERILPDRAGAGEAPGWAKNLWRQFGYGWDGLNHAWNQWVINYNGKRQRNLLSSFLSHFGLDSGLDSVDWKAMVTLLVAGIIFVLLVIAFLLLRPLQRQGKKDPAQAAYQRFCRKLARHGMTRKPEEGAQDFSRRTRQQHPELGPAVANITSLYQRLRYAPHPPADSLQRLQAAVRKFRP